MIFSIIIEENEGKGVAGLQRRYNDHASSQH